MLRLYAHDPDAGDSIAVRWRVADTSKNALRLKNVSDNLVQVCVQRHDLQRHLHHQRFGQA